MDNCVGWCDSWDGEVVVTEVNCVRDVEGVGFGIDDLMAMVMLEGDANKEFVRCTEVPGAAGGWLVVDNDGAAKWQERGSIVVEGAICPKPFAGIEEHCRLVEGGASYQKVMKSKL
jgi:hypothetical protein